MTPQKEIKGLTFFPVPEFSGLDAAFGAGGKTFFNRDDLPEVPSQYPDMAEKLFYSGGAIPDLHPSVDRSKAATALQAWLSSFQPSHEAKMATAGYALWLWTHPTALSADA